MSFVNLNITIIQSASLSRPSSLLSLVLSVSLCGQPQDLHPLSSLSLSFFLPSRVVPFRGAILLRSVHRTFSFLRSSLPASSSTYSSPVLFHRLRPRAPALKFQISFNRIGYVPVASFADDASSSRCNWASVTGASSIQASIRIIGKPPLPSPLKISFYFISKRLRD